MLAQGAGVHALLDRLKEDPDALKLEFTIDSIEGMLLFYPLDTFILRPS